MKNMPNKPSEVTSLRSEPQRRRWASTMNQEDKTLEELRALLALDHAHDVASAKLESAGGDIAAVQPPYRTVLAVMAAHGLIENGSMMQFFDSDFPNSPPYTIFIEAYRAIGATNAAACLERAVASFPFEYPEREKEKRVQFINAHYDEKTFTVGIWDHSFVRDENVYRLLLKYVGKHVNEFPMEE